MKVYQIMVESLDLDNYRNDTPLDYELYASEAKAQEVCDAHNREEGARLFASELRRHKMAVSQWQEYEALVKAGLRSKSYAKPVKPDKEAFVKSFMEGERKNNWVIYERRWYVEALDVIE